MDDRIGRLVATFGADRTVVGKAAPQILIKEGPKAHIDARRTRMSGARIMMRSASSPSDAGGMIGGVAAGVRLWLLASASAKSSRPSGKRPVTQLNKAGADAVGNRAAPGLAGFV